MKKEKTFYLGLNLIVFIFMMMLVPTILFIFKVSINRLNFIIALLLTIIFYYLIMKKRKYILKDIIKYIFYFIVIIVISIIVSGKIYDTTADGTSYHKVAIGELANGWNPVYDKVEQFNNSNKNKSLKLLNTHDIWVDHYAKGYWIYAANVYKFTGNIETGKSILIIIIISTFLLTYSYLCVKIRRIYSLIISLLLAINPVIVYQFSSFYNDGLLGNLTMLLILSLMMIIDKKIKDKKYNYLLFFLLLCILINIKFTGFAYAGIYSLVFFIYILFNQNQRKENLWKILITGCIALSISIGIIGLSSYPKNLKEHNHPFYPLFGENKVDIIKPQTPAGLYNMNSYKRFLIANFSKTYNGDANIDPGYEIKLPLTFSTSELELFKNPDVRVGGYGVLFGGILIIGIIGGIYALYRFKKEKLDMYPFILPVIATLFLIIILKEAWWARYFPQFYMMPLLVIMMLCLIKQNKICKSILWLLIGTMVINIYLIINPAYEQLKLETKTVNNQINEIKSTNAKEKMYVITDMHGYYNKSMYDGAAYNLYDLYKNIEVINPIENLEGYHKIGFMGVAKRVEVFIKK